MSKRTTTVTLGGNELVLDVGSIEFYIQFHDCTGIDLVELYSSEQKIKEMEERLKTIESFKFSAGVVYAGYAAAKINSGNDPELKFETVRRLINSLNPAEAAKYTADYFNLLRRLNSNGDAPEEEKKEMSQLILEG